MNQEKNGEAIIDSIDAIARAVAASFPVLASVATLWSEHKNYVQFENIKDTVEKYAKQLEELEDKVDKDFLATPEVLYIVQRTLDKAKNEYREEKRKMLADFLSNASTKKLAGDSEKDMIVETIDKLSPFQAKLLKGLSRRLVAQSGVESVLNGEALFLGSYKDGTYEEFFFLDFNFIDQHKITLQDIEASFDYMIATGVVATKDFKSKLKNVPIEEMSGYRPTMLGIKVLDYLGMPLNEVTTFTD